MTPITPFFACSGSSTFVARACEKVHRMVDTKPDQSGSQGFLSCQALVCPCIQDVIPGPSLPGGFRLWMSFPVSRGEAIFPLTYDREGEEVFIMV